MLKSFQAFNIAVVRLLDLYVVRGLFLNEREIQGLSCFV